MAGKDAATTGPQRRRLRRGQGLLLGATIMLLVGAFLPWLYTGAGPISGARGPGLWTFYASMLALAGALVPRRGFAIAQAVICALAALGLPLWQLIHVWSLVGFGGWAPGPGIVMTIGGGAVCIEAARRLIRSRES